MHCLMLIMASTQFKTLELHHQTPSGALDDLKHASVTFSGLGTLGKCL